MTVPGGWTSVVAAGLIVVVLALPCAGQPTDAPEDPVQRVESLYRQGRLDRAELVAFRLLGQPDGLTGEQRAELYRILAFTAVARDETAQARSYFLQALEANPDLALNRTLTSPKILAVFDEARSEMSGRQLRQRTVSAYELRACRLRLEGGTRSLLLPGLGQYHKGHNLRGTLFMSATGVSLVGLVFSQIIALDAGERYRDAEDPATAQSAWEDYSTAWSWRNGFGYATAALWLGAALEAYLTPPLEPERRFAISVTPLDRRSPGAAIGLTVHF